ncbi:serine-rich adhesin for platelets-like [Dendropsophus ebraccatus]|uniref:serine-rich adhesin for platelets-like n=1 Tax=Dendropsophus ebraccatus TaxID=150705 RepID=UPI003831C8BF
MDSKVTVLELQNDLSVKQVDKISPTFPRTSKGPLYIVTNQKTQLHLLNNLAGSPRTKEKSVYQYGLSNKVFSVSGPKGTEWEVRLLLSPSEISRLSTNYNLMGFLISCPILQSSMTKKANVQALCEAASQFLVCSEEAVASNYCQMLKKTLTEKLKAFCTGRQKMVGALVALVAAELATSVAGNKSFDYKVGEKKAEKDQRKQILKMIKVFNVMSDLLTVIHQGKRVQIVFRNPCPDKWASGGKKFVDSGETFVFGLCHKVVSISEDKSEIQFLQNLQESYELVSVFHLPAFAEHLLMTSSWRNKIELFLKEQDRRKEIIDELSSLARCFICTKPRHQKAFLKEFQSEMVNKWSSVEPFVDVVGDEVVCAFGILVAILAAVTAKSKCISNSEEEDPEEEEPAAVAEDTNGSAASAGSSSTSMDHGSSSHEGINAKEADGYGGTQPDLGSSPDELVGPDGAKYSTCDPDTTEQGSIDDSQKNVEPRAESPGVSKPDIADQKLSNDNSGVVIDTDVSSIGITSVPDTTDQCSVDGSPKIREPPSEFPDVSKPDFADQKLGNDNADERVKEEDESVVVGLDSAKSIVGITSVPDTTDQGSVDDSPKTVEPLAGSPGVSKPDIADQKQSNDNAGVVIDTAGSTIGITSVPDTTDQGSVDGSPTTVEPQADSPCVSKPDIADQKQSNDNGVVIDTARCSIGITSVPDTTDEGSADGSPKIREPPAKFPDVSKPDIADQKQGNDNADERVKEEDESGGVGIDSAKSIIAITSVPDTTDQGSVDGSPKTVKPLAGSPCVSKPDQKLDNDDSDESSRKYPETRDYAQESDPVCPETELGLHSQGSGDSADPDDSKDDGFSEVAQPPNVGARETALETQDLTSNNTFFNMSFIGFMLLLVVVVMLTNVLPQSMTSALIVIILGLMGVKWFLRLHP